jgi:hypothetical protein
MEFRARPANPAFTAGLRNTFIRSRDHPSEELLFVGPTCDRLAERLRALQLEVHSQAVLPNVMLSSDEEMHKE